MNKVLIVDASESDYRLMSSLLSKRRYEPIIVNDKEAAKQEVAKLPPGSMDCLGYEVPGWHCERVN